MEHDNERVLLVRRPDGRADESCFVLDRQSVPALEAGQVLVRNVYVSCDPYLRQGMDSYLPIGQPVTARAVGEVVESADQRFVEGDVVWGFLGWEQFSVVRAEALTGVDPAMGPLSHAIGVRGMNGLTAWVGMVDIGQPVPGDTVVVSAGTGSVGSVAGQLARLAGARVVAVVGGEHKVRHAIDNLGYDDAIDYKAAPSLPEALAAACPGGIDVYFDNVGGDVLNAVLGHLRKGARLAMCGAVSQYDQGAAPAATGLYGLLGSGVTMKWFGINDYLDRLPEFVARMARLVADGDMIFYEDIVSGIENVPAAFLGLLRGEKLGKCLVRVGEEPARVAAP